MSGREDLVQAPERFQILGKLGSGGMGVVYRAHDRERHTDVALKVLRGFSGRDIYRFKREFRALADVAHPNLVGLYELQTAGDEWFLTMELIDGVPFIEWVRPGARSSLAALAEATPPRGPVDPHEATADTLTVSRRSATHVRAPIEAPLLLEHLDEALYQLCDTVHALHLAGKLHRDLKPSNVLVDQHGRFVLLDFGLVADVGAVEYERTHEVSSAVGTPAYMSPEQAADQPLTTASDWYAIGVMLYETLTGRRPFDLRHQGALPSPHHFAPESPPHLVRLCEQLLAEDPARRPTGEQVLAALGREPSTASRELAVSLQSVPFVGREAELAELRRSLASARAGEGRAVFLRGESGMGKSALLARFREEVGDALVLRGRCFERENVPFKTLDTVVDALSSVLLARPEEELRAAIGSDAWALGRLFPALRRVALIADPETRPFGGVDPIELRRRAFAALRTLLFALARRTPLVLELDDLQWGDADSGQFLAELLEEGGSAHVLCLLAHRADGSEGPLLAALARARALGPAHGMASSELTLGPLSAAESRALVRLVGGAHDPARAREVVHDAGGVPLFLAELGRAGHTGSLDDSVRARVARLPDDARALVELCAVAGRPLQLGVLLRAANLPEEGQRINRVRAERLLRVRREGEHEPALETYHDRVRTAIVSGLPPEQLATLHRALAETLERSGGAEEALVGHWLGAGQPERAAGHALAAAAAAEERLAFHRAADFLALALAHAQLADGEARALRLRMGQAMVHAGRLVEAADTFAEAAASATSEADRLECQRLELEQRLRCGQLDAGLVLANTLLADLGLSVPRSRGGVLVSVLKQRFLLRLSQREIDRDARPELPAATVQRLGLLQSLSNGLAFVNPLYGRAIQARFLREALQSGDPRHVGRAWCFEIGYLAARGGKSYATAMEVTRRAMDIADHLDDTLIAGHARAAGGLAAALSGHFAEARASFLAGEKLLREAGAGVRWELDLTEMFLVQCAWYLGEGRELVRLVASYLREADERGDVYAQRGHRGWRGNLAWLLVGLPDEARAQLAAVAAPLGAGDDPQVGHYYEGISACHIDLYVGDGAAAHARIEALWPALERAMLTRVQSIDIEGHFLRGRAALAAGVAPALVARCEKRLRAIGMPWSRPMAEVLRAGRSVGSAEEIVALRAARDGFAAAGMGFFAAATARRLGHLVAGEEGQAFARAAAEHFAAEQVADVPSLCRVLIGRPD